MGWPGHGIRRGNRRGAYKVLVGIREGKRPLGKPMRRWENNINMDLQSMRWGSLDWIDLAQDRDRSRLLVHAAMNFRVP